MRKEEAIEIIAEILENVCAGRCNSKSNFFRKRVEALEMAMDALSDLTTVRCKDCLFCDKRTLPYYCRAIHLTRDSYDYCSRGRREHENTNTEDPSHPFAEDVMMEK